MPKKPSKPDQQIIPIETIERRIFLIRGQKVMLDRDLAELYGVTTRRLNQQIRRNLDRFPEDFAFLLTQQEFANLKSHFATSRSPGGRLVLPPKKRTNDDSVDISRQAISESKGAFLSPAVI